MGLFGAKKPGGAGGIDLAAAAAAVGAVAPLDREQTAWVVQRWLAAMAAAGLAIERVQPDLGLVAADGRTFYLNNLAALLARVDPGEWGDVIGRVVEQGAAPAPAAGAQGEDLLAALLPRVLAESNLDGKMLAALEPYSPPLGAGLLQLACVDTPERVETLFRGDRLAPFGGWDAVYPRLLANLRALRPAPAHDVLQPGAGAAGIHVWESDDDDFFGATRVLLLGELLAEAGDPLGPLGAVVAIPNRHYLMAHALRDQASLLACLPALAQLAPRAFSDGAGSLSPFVYYQRAPGALLEQVTVLGEDQGIEIQVRGEFAAAFEALGGPPRG
jgi:hypothetical protein